MQGTISSVNVEMEVQRLADYLEHTSNDVICYSGWLGLGASTVLRAIVEHPPPSLSKKFEKIIHIDCSRWKSRRALQMAICDELKLKQQVAADFECQDAEDDFSGIDQGSRAEIPAVATMIARYLAQYTFLVVFHNGSDSMVDLTTCGIPPTHLFDSKILWCFSGRLRFHTKDFQEKHGSQYCFLDALVGDTRGTVILEEEAREISFNTHKLGLGITPEIAKECCIYLLSMKGQARNMIDYNWATHASNYWVCEGILEGGQENTAWELAHAMQQYTRIVGDSSSFDTATMFGLNMLDVSAKHWICSTHPNLKQVPSSTTSLFFEPRGQEWYGRPIVSSLASDTFHKAYQLRVLKLWRCRFSFSSPPFHCCCNLRFLGLDSCMDEQNVGEQDQTGTRAMETFQRLWVLDVCHTDWQLLSFPPDGTKEEVAPNIREVHINNGKIWHNNLAWRRLSNLRKLRVVKPTSPWETAGKEDEFMNMVKLELLDLSGNITMQVLPSLSDATGLKTLVLDGCVGLEQVGPQGLPPSLESFHLDAGRYQQNEARISRICLAGSARLSDFKLQGWLPDLEELDLSHTSIKVLNLRSEVVEMRNLQRLLLMGCRQLRSISWPHAYISRLSMLCIGTQDMRFLRSLGFYWLVDMISKLNLCLSSTNKHDGRSCHEENMLPHPTTAAQVAAGLPLPKSLTYHDLSFDKIAAAVIDGSSGSSSRSMQYRPLDFHMEIGEGISDVTDKTGTQLRDAIGNVMSRVQSLHVHDSSSITAVAPDHFFDSEEIMTSLKWCRVERCPKLGTVFATSYNWACFSELEIFWAAHLLMARSVWSRPRDQRWSSISIIQDSSFTRLRAIHLHLCPRLRYVVPMASNNKLSNVLETLHIHCCGDLRQVFPVEQEFLEKISSAGLHEKGMLEFSNLKSLYLYDLLSLQQICEAKMFAPKLETIYIRGCWGLRRLPATDSRRHREDGRPVAVDCEKDWWDKLEWDGMEFGHDPSVFQPRHSRYYKKRHLRGTVLR